MASVHGEHQKLLALLSVRILHLTPAFKALCPGKTNMAVLPLCQQGTLPAVAPHIAIDLSWLSD
jgi:hypothetical protein